MFSFRKIISSKSILSFLSVFTVFLSLPLFIFLFLHTLLLQSNAQVAEPTSFTFTAAGDHASNNNSNASIDVVAASGSNFYLALGDLSYQAGGEQAWCQNFKSRFNDVEIIAGNHDTGESAGGDINNYVLHCPFTLSGMTGEYGKQYYFDYPQTQPLARFIMIAPGIKGSMNINYSVGGAGYVFTENAITDARARGIKWLVVGMHKNCISTGDKVCEIGTDIMNLLINNKVDLVLQSHDHNYQRSHQLRCLNVNSVDPACVSDDGIDGIYSKGTGSVILINGEFGQPLYPVSDGDPHAGYFAKIDSTTFGVTKYTVTDTQLSAQYMRSAGGGFADSFVISASPITPTPTPPTSTLSLLPIADTYVNDASPAANYGSATTMQVDGNPTEVSYIKFDLSSLAEKKIASAKLRMKITNASSSTQRVKEVVDTTWSEAGMTWDNRPALSPTVLHTINVATPGAIVETDITALIENKKGQLVSLGIDVDQWGWDGLAFKTKEATSDKLSLIVTFEEPLATPTMTSTPMLFPTMTPVPTITPLPTVTPTPASTTISLLSIADTYVSKASPSANFGKSTLLQIDGNPVEISYLKFDLKSLAGKKVATAKLRMKIANESVSTQRIKQVSNTSWDENTMTWKNRPSLSSTVSNTIKASTPGSIVEADITSLVKSKQGQLLSVGIDTDSSGWDGMGFLSKEAMTDKVSLVITLQTL